MIDHHKLVRYTLNLSPDEERREIQAAAESDEQVRGRLEEMQSTLKEQLQPVAPLLARLPVRGPSYGAAFRNRLPRVVPALLVGLAVLTGIATTAGVAILVWQAYHPEKIVERVVYQAPDFSDPVVASGLRVEAVRGGSGVAVVQSGQKYTYRVRAATSRTHGWLFLVDRRSVSLLEELRRQPDGTLAAVRNGTFDKTVGWEFFVTVLADAEFPEGRAKEWLTQADLDRLQELGEEGDDEATRAVVVAALLRAGFEKGRFDVRLERVRHE